MENTALANYWAREFIHGDGAPALCTQCDPETGKWHERFPRTQIRADQEVGPDGFVYMKDDKLLARLRHEKDTE